MKKSVKVIALVVLSMVLVYGVMMFSGCTSSSSDSTPAAAAPKYAGTIFMASETGGHIGIFDVTIDTANTTTPITITNGGGAGAIKQLSGTAGNAPKHVFHDVRYDAANKRVYYSTIVPDDALTAGASATLATAHVGYIDVTNEASIPAAVDATIDVDVAGTTAIMNLQFPTIGDVTNPASQIVGLPLVYCASAVTPTNYIALSMTVPAYIDVIKKADIVSNATLTHSRFTVEAFRGAWDSTFSNVSLFAHGMVSSPDQSKLYIAVNEVVVDGLTTGAGAGAIEGHPRGQVTGYLLKMSDVVSGTVTTTSVTKSYTITGLAGSTSTAPTVAFRSSFTPDGTMILQSGKDRFFVLDGTTLVPKNGATGDLTIGAPAAGHTNIENHDAMSTPDGKFAILTIRYSDSTTGSFQTGGLQLYDLTTMKPVGGVTATCSACHATAGTLNAADHHLCGLDGHLAVQ